MSIAEALASLPATIRVGPFDWKLVRLDATTGADRRIYGECSSMSMEIRLSELSPSTQKAVDTMLHEIGHAIFWAYGLESSDSEERLVSTMGTAWTQVFQDNPWLLLWIAKGVRS